MDQWPAMSLRALAAAACNAPSPVEAEQLIARNRTSEPVRIVFPRIYSETNGGIDDCDDASFVAPAVYSLCD
ncbi:hypothetical protein [Burkholderia sp. F1]|uniref:hypothetical protein n=1 Tax=Burkholderia sp. F1 TaxID=3366817 RepID=UPI003D74946A